jgi:hypothetical protein
MSPSACCILSIPTVLDGIDRLEESHSSDGRRGTDGMGSRAVGGDSHVCDVLGAIASFFSITTIVTIAGDQAPAERTHA